MKTTDKYTDRDWEKLAAFYAGESGLSDNTDLPESDEALDSAGKAWKEIGEMNRGGIIDTNSAWKKVVGRIDSEKVLPSGYSIFPLKSIMKVAATIFLITGLGAAIIWFTNNSSKDLTVIASGDKRNVEVKLPDGSHVWLNRNSKISYNNEPSADNRSVKLTGEAFFDVVRDETKPFVIDAGTGTVTVLGTSFNVISSNENNQLEVLVETGRVKVTESQSGESVTLEPGFLGKVGGGFSEAVKNNNQNYISWKTDLLTYNGENLGTIFSDLKKVHNIDISVADQAILNESWFMTFDKLPPDTIVKIICTTFNLKYIKEGEKYTLSR